MEQKFNIGDEVVLPLIINKEFIKKDGYNIPTLGIIKSIQGDDFTITDKYNIFNMDITIKNNMIESVLYSINGKDFYENMIQKTKLYNTKDTRFSQGPAAANLYFTNTFPAGAD